MIVTSEAEEAHSWCFNGHAAVEFIVILITAFAHKTAANGSDKPRDGLTDWQTDTVTGKLKETETGKSKRLADRKPDKLK